MDEIEINKKSEEPKALKKEEKLKVWLKNPYNFAIIVILILSLVILLYYFNLTKSQPLWWDESEYMSIAKTWAFGIPYDINSQRPLLFPFFAFLLYKIGLQELGIKFLLVIIPSWLSVFFTYIFIRELYDKKTALIVAFITAVSWIHLFYSMRLMTDAIGLLFGILSFLFFWKGYIKNQSRIYVWLIGFFIGLSFLCRLTGIFYGAVIVLFLIFTQNFRFLKNKNTWIIPLVFILTITPFLIFDQIYYHNAFAFTSGYGGPQSNSFAWWMLQFIYDYPEFGFFIFFLIGLLTLIPMFLSFDKVILGKEKKYNPDLFMFLSILFTLILFIFVLRNAENRWLILMSIGIFTISAKGILLIYEFIIKNADKKIAILFIICALIFGAYFELNHTDLIIKDKVNSYSQVKEAGLWIKENSNKNDSVATTSIPQITYYSERKVISFYNSSEPGYYTPDQFSRVIDSTKPKYLVISVFEPSVPEWTYTFPNQNSSRFIPVKAWFGDAEQKQPILVIYKIDY